MKLVPLGDGFFAKVDNEDFAQASEHNWSVLQLTSTYTSRRYARHGNVYLHRFLTKCPTGKVVHHKNHDTLDNRRQNLQICSQKDNNRHRAKTYGSSQYKGVTRDGNRWAANICVNRRMLKIGRYSNEEDAATAYNVAAQLFFGEFACLNPV